MAPMPREPTTQPAMAMLDKTFHTNKVTADLFLSSLFQLIIVSDCYFGLTTTAIKEMVLKPKSTIYHFHSFVPCIYFKVKKIVSWSADKDLGVFFLFFLF